MKNIPQANRIFPAWKGVSSLVEFKKEQIVHLQKEVIIIDCIQL
jgi:hypothetical protein